jgi:SAM-dependent methyltransferase
MIARARQAVPDTVEFRQVDRPHIPLADGHADAVLSVHVMQHLESKRVLDAYIADMYRVLRPGGTAMIHIPLIGAPAKGLAALRDELTLRRSRRALNHGGVHETMRTRAYWLNEVWQAFTASGFTDVELRLIPVRSNGYGHQFWFGRVR